MSVHAGTGDQPVGDIGELYRVLARQLEQVVKLDVHASDAVIEDACQFAWIRLLHHQARVERRGALAWLATTAGREAVKLVRREARCESLDAVIECSGDSALAEWTAGPEELVEAREQLGVVGRLPERQQRALWLHAAGLNYVEIADSLGCTRRTVERQLLRAKHDLRELAAATQTPTARPRAGRMGRSSPAAARRTIRSA